MMASWREPHEEKPKPAAPSAAKHTSPGKGAGASSQSAPPNKKLLLPPVSKELRTFQPQKEPKKEGADEEDEDEGIKYVDKLVLVGGVLGLGLKANGEYVGTPSFQWFRRKMVRGQRLFLPIEGASTDEYVPNADDVNTVLRLECTPPYGGAKLVVDTDEIAVDPSTHQMLSQMLSRGHAEFNCVQVNGGEPRILLITLKNIKVRGRLSRLTTSATTIYKQGYEMPLTLVLDPHSPTEVSLRMGTQSFALNFESSRVRDVAALCVRMFAGPSCPEHEDANATGAFSEQPNEGGFDEDSGRAAGAKRPCRDAVSMETCSICLEPFACKECMRRLPCRHLFHTTCIDHWLTSCSNLCPECNVSVE